MRRTALVLLALSSFVTHGQGYCSVCKDHTMCKHPTEDPGSACVNYENHFFTASEKTAILNKHNELRRSVADGKIDEHPKALDIVDLIWNEEDALIARRLALTCVYGHDSCRKHKDGTYAGQNIYKAWSSKGFENKYLDGVQGWFDEYALYKPDWTNRYPSGVEGVGHYTQIMWSRTTHVGCERSYWSKTEYLVCNYSPGGNVNGEMVYQALAVRHRAGVLMLSVSVILALNLNLFTGSL